MRRKRRQDGGFTLLEVMVAFVIAGLATIVLLRAGFSGAQQDRAAAQIEDATARAQSRLASLGVLTPLRTEQLSGDDGGGYRWLVSIRLLQQSGPLALYAITLTERFGGRGVTLRTERLAAGS
jgi:general secretion pathway protein I